MMAVFLLMGCNVTDNIPNQTAPDIKVKAVHLIKDEDKEPKKPSPDDFNFISELCDPVIVLAEGTVLFKGKADEVRKNDSVIESYLGKGIKRK